jgi:hypothetical protein
MKDERVYSAFRIVYNYVHHKVGLEHIPSAYQINDDGSEGDLVAVIMADLRHFSEKKEEVEKLAVKMPEYMKQIRDYVTGPMVARVR